MPIIGDFQFKGGLKFPAGAAAALYPKPIDSPETVVAGTSVEGVPVETLAKSYSSVSLYAIAVDLQGNMYVASTGGLTKLDSTGHTLWAWTGAAAYGVAVDLQGSAYVGIDGGIKKIVNGEEVWTYSGFTGGGMWGDGVCAVATDPQGNVYGAGYSKTIQKISSSGSKVWSFTAGGTLNSVAVDLQGNVYSGGSNSTVYKLNSDGVQAWVFTGQTEQAYGVAADFQGNVYSCSGDGNVYRISNSGQQVWKTYDGSPYGVCVSVAGEVYISASGHLLKRSKADGTKVWDFAEHATNQTTYTGSGNLICVDLQGNIYYVLATGYLCKVFDGRIIHTS